MEQYESKYWEIDPTTPNAYRPKQGYVSKTVNGQMIIERDYITPTVEEEAILKDPKLLEILSQEVQKKVVGEDLTIKTILLIGAGIYVENHQTASFNLLLNDESGGGKDFILKSTIEIFPADKVVKRTRISPTTLTYWHSKKSDPDKDSQKAGPEWTWDGKILALMDISNSILNSDVFKVYVSDGSIATIVKDQKAFDITIIGKPIVILTSYGANPNNEMLRRFPFMQIDTTKDQTKSIKRSQALLACTGARIIYNTTIKLALQYLERVNVRIPYAERLPEHFPDSLIMRTHFQRLLDYIKASCALHQYQREKDSEGYYIATPQDYDNAAIVMERTTSNAEMIPLTKKQRQLLEIMKTEESWRVTHLMEKVSFYSQGKLYGALDALVEQGFLTVEMRDVADSKRSVKFFSVSKIYNGYKIPSWNDICQNKEIKESMENKENKENEGNDINSLNSLNSPLFSPFISEEFVLKK